MLAYINFAQMDKDKIAAHWSQQANAQIELKV